MWLIQLQLYDVSRSGRVKIKPRLALAIGDRVMLDELAVSNGSNGFKFCRRCDIACDIENGFCATYDVFAHERRMFHVENVVGELQQLSDPELIASRRKATGVNGKQVMSSDLTCHRLDISMIVTPGARVACRSPPQLLPHLLLTVTVTHCIR